MLFYVEPQHENQIKVDMFWLKGEWEWKGEISEEGMFLKAPNMYFTQQNRAAWKKLLTVFRVNK